MKSVKVSDPTAASTRATSPTESPATRFRWVVAAAGVTCVGLGLVGAFVPGLPTTVFVLSGSCLLARSSPTLERRLRSNRRLSPYLKYADPTTPMPRRAKVAALVSMWTSIGLSALALKMGHVNDLVTTAVLLAGVVGTGAIVLFRRDAGRRAGRLRSAAPTYSR
ncbi:hypothetical protein TBR22_A42110 [Luteitalea sp. TBR-22]|nr:hypothetical protein TBR22_A42110 [Luteitalea sp. TBR-22]